MSKIRVLIVDDSLFMRAAIAKTLPATEFDVVGQAKNGTDALAQVKHMVVMQGMRLALVGVVIGLASAYGLTRFIASFLFGVKALDPAVFAAIPLLLTAVALLAVWIPARRASRVDPVIALRTQ